MGQKVSRYVAFSDHTYRDSDGDAWQLLYATRTGLVLPVMAEVVGLLREGDLAALADEVREGLTAAQALVDEQSDELSDLLAERRAAAADRSKLTYALLPTSYCNMGCTYCGQAHTRKRLEPNHRDAVVRRVAAGIARPTTKAVEIGWFGGEPMAGYPVIRELSRPLIEAADEHGVDYKAHIVTNGSLLTMERLATLHHECRVVHAEITLDGPQRIHDVHRPLKNGKGSFQHIVRVVQQVLREPGLEGLTIGLRTNVSRDNAAYVEEYLRLMAEAGMADDRVVFSIHEVHSWGNDVSELQVARAGFAEQELEWMRLMTELDLRFQTLPGEAKKTVCVAVTRSAEIISSTGNVFSCSEHPLVPEAEQNRALAHVDTHPVQQARPLGEFDDWYDSVERGGESPCDRCLFFPVCGGFCPKQWREGTVTCPSFKTNLQGRFDVTAQLNEMQPI
ncbi:radical SAM protein [Kitasatospora sp. NBC_01250]|uniref:radical SAM/SPASM domain-containing protein n=1 Tax=Kitasatospora sp. NBC_01250 TaxID=2903571 RepID=UPI002E2F1694|nr:radical SAM protein [Kitasatospora sp. NBC_01250]